ncbi:MAG: 4Fe-4S dicluster domain-containing protein [Coriobacteriales bacterium]|jgi:ferredoxin-type protein NapG|nr:4Fe-4S dicluster domain-containing protein [Coriobacteriales bacterium]
MSNNFSDPAPFDEAVVDDELDPRKDTGPNAEKDEGSSGMTRRTVVLGAGGAAVMLGLGGLGFIGNDPIIRPPGGQDENHLVSACIRCERCYEICPRNAIAPTHIENGLLNMRTPTLDFSDDFCDWCAEENGGDPLCVKVCPTEALSLPPGATALDTMIGKAVINTDWCLAYRLIGCRFCYDACPYEAMELDENNRPVVLYDICNGCGACESVCVSLQNGSISEGADEVAIVIRTIDENGDVVPRKTGFPF